jgi:hypothetical protein
MLADLVKDSQALDRAIAGEELSYKDGLELMNYDNLHLLAATLMSVLLAVKCVHFIVKKVQMMHIR